MLHLSKHLTTDGTSMCLMETGAKKKGEFGTPLGVGRTILNNMKNVCAPCVCNNEGVVYCWLVLKGYLRWRVGVSCRTSSQMWCNWYLPRFLLRDESLTLMNMASLMVLVTTCTSLPTMEMLSTLMQWSVDWLSWKMGEGPLGVPKTCPQRSLLIPQCIPPHTLPGCT